VRIATCPQQVVSHFECMGSHGHARERKAACTKRIRDERPECVVGIRRWEGPNLFGQFTKIDVPALDPMAGNPGCNHICTAEQNFEAHLIVSAGAGPAIDNQIGTPIVETSLKISCGANHDLKHHSGITADKPIDNRRDEACCKWGRSPDAHFAAGGIGKRLDVLHCLPQLVEGSIAPAGQCAAIVGEFRAARTAIEELHSECSLQIPD
jgi:hypothetical protein